MPSVRQPSARQSGVTLFELMVAVAILGVLTALAVPSFDRAYDKRRAQNVAEAIAADLRWARSESIKRNRLVRVSYTEGSTWNYTIHADPAGTNTLLKTVSSTDFNNSTINTNFTSDQATFDPVRGTATNGSVSFSTLNFAGEVRLSILGRVRICNLEGYSAC